MNRSRKYARATNILLPLTAIMAGVLAIGSTLAFKNYDLVSQFMGQETSKKVNTSGEEVDSEYYKADYAKLKKLQSDEKAYALDVQSEGSVLLQNNGLPLSESKTKITILGYMCTEKNFLIGGGGSGSIDTSKTPSLKDVFELAGYEVNDVMWDFYTSGDGKADYGTSKSNEIAMDKYTDTEKASFKNFNDAAIVVISRKGTEASDVPDGLLTLADNEKALISMAEENFDNVIVLLNTMNAMSLGDLASSKKVSILWVGAGGQQGLRAIPEMINGTRSPSGRLVDTYAYDAHTAPAMQNFGNYVFDGMTDTYVNYAEGIYVGYKYYETRYADKVNGVANVGDYQYSTQVQYPFGYGLSYCDFEYSDFKFDSSTMQVSVKVTNKSDGEIGSKETVEVYMQSPYTEYDKKNGVEKSAIQLVGFTKTDEILPGADQTVTIQLDKDVMKAYDAKGAKTYIVDDGDYYFSIGSDAHDALNNILAKQGKTTADGMDKNGNSNFVGVYHQDKFDSTTYATSVNNTTITNQFDDVDYSYWDSNFKYLTRQDWTGTFPTPLGGEAKTLVASEKLKEALAAPEIADSNVTMPTTGDTSTNMKLVQMMGKKYDDADWEKLLNQLTIDEMVSLVTNSGYGNPAAKSVSKPYIYDKDGPAGISSTLIGGAGCFGFPTENLLASTWNVELADKMGYFVGEDSLFSKIAGWYAPSMNIHRTAYSGRNFEYYSEDGFISGQFGSAVVKAARAKGVNCYIKHFAVNDQETNRSLVATFTNEQALREIYLKPFEDSVEKGGANAVMVSMNRIGTRWTGASKALITNTLRNEWGFQGGVLTDAETSYTAHKDVKAALYAGTDFYLCPTAGIWTIDTTNAYNVSMLRNACHNILFMAANSNAMNGLDANTEVVKVTPAWVYWLVIADVALGLILGGGLVFHGVRWYMLSKKEKEEN